MKSSKKSSKFSKRLQKRYKKLSKVVAKKQKKYIKLYHKLYRRYNKQLHKYFKRLFKKINKKYRKFLKSVRKEKKKLSKQFKTQSRRPIFVTGSMLLLLVIAGSGLGVVYAYHASNNKPVAIAKPVVTVPKPKVFVPLGPAQANPTFATYPTWAQNYATDTSSTIDQKYWNIAEGPAQNGNKEAEYYTDSSTNLYVQNGALTLKATQQAEPQNYNYASARVDTDNKQSFLYGRIDITAEIPNGVGTWPAAWLLPANNKYEDLSPLTETNRYLNGGEMDLVEEVGFRPNVEYGIVHDVADLKNPNGVGTYNTITLRNNQSIYYKYSLLWTPTTITFEVNDVAFYEYTRPVNASYITWPFDQPFYLILNLAIGGTWGGEDQTEFPNGIDNSALPSSMNISSIYYYPYNQTPNQTPAN